MILTLLLAHRRTRPPGRVVGWGSTAAVLLVGVATISDGWAPRRLYGWPFLAYGLVMVIGLIAVRRPVRKDALPGRA
ncbi:hypothetical protein Psi01_47630 [Planobispora siamensis]|uniref:Uncharacterized protein n=1 Tax=Planobispora siamensis TaxID=936338 RepID=A0A8J3SGZ9_9ACTN|nr:hypothetical protein Psi01_47630 [Planobispora siamensis]